MGGDLRGCIVFGISMQRWVCGRLRIHSTQNLVYVYALCLFENSEMVFGFALGNDAMLVSLRV